MLPASDKSSVTKGLAGINGWGTINLNLHASVPLQTMHSPKILKLLNSTATMPTRFSQLQRVGSGSLTH